MTQQPFNQSSPLDFRFIPEVQDKQVDHSQARFADIVVVAKNCSGRPVRVHPFLVPVGFMSETDDSMEPGGEWIEWLSIEEEEAELDLDQDRTHPFHIHIKLPPRPRMGTYFFRLAVSGVDNTDEAYDQSDVITFTVKGPKLGMAPFAIATGVFLALAVLGILAAILFLNRPSIQATLNAQEAVVPGEWIAYELEVTNNGSGLAKNIIVTYTLPEAIEAAGALLEGETVRHCERDAEPWKRPNTIRCNLGDLASKGAKKLTFRALPGPRTKEILLADKKGGSYFTVTAQTDAGGESTDVVVKPALQSTKIQVTGQPGGDEPFVIALLPSTYSPLIGEEFAYQVFAWTKEPILDGEATPEISFKFTLPDGMRYTEVPEECRPDAAKEPSHNSFTLTCSAKLPYASTRDGIKNLNLRARASTVSRDSTARLEAVTYPAGQETKKSESAAINVLNTALYFDGKDDWVELGYTQAPRSFTIEMWVHPYSKVDGQSFAGLHRTESDGTVSNVFLVGYWGGSLQVNVNGESHNLISPLRTDRHNLMVVVGGAPSDPLSGVTVYKNGEKLEWVEPSTDDERKALKEKYPELACDEYCKVFHAALPGGENPLPWVLGQDWDTGQSSDFFQGTLSDVRIWTEPFNEAVLKNIYRLPPTGTEKNLAAYYRLEPVDLASDTLPALGKSALPGKRHGATWVEAGTRFGGALQFNGFNQFVAVPSLLLDGFSVNEQGIVTLTIAGWIRVDEVPTRQEWILGSIEPAVSTRLTGPGRQVEMAGLVAAGQQTALEAAEKQMEDAEQAGGEVNLDVDSIIAESYLARLQLFTYLRTLMRNPLDPQHDLITTKVPALLGATRTPPPSVAKVVTDVPSVREPAAAVQSHFEGYQAVKEGYDLLSTVVPTSKPTSTPTPKPAPITVTVCDEKHFLFFTYWENCRQVSVLPSQVPEMQNTMTPTVGAPDPYQGARILQQMLVLVMDEEQSKYYTELIALLDAANKNNVNVAASAGIKMNDSKLLEKAKNIQDGFSELGKVLAYQVMRSLALMEYQLNDVRIAAETRNGEDWITTFQKLQAAKSEFDQALLELEKALQQRRNEILKDIPAGADISQDNKDYLVLLDGTLSRLDLYKNAQKHLEEAQVAQAKIRVAKEQLALEAARKVVVEIAATDEQKKASIDQYRGLLESMDAFQPRENALSGLEPQFDAAADQAVAAAFAAVEDANLGRWIIPYLDYVIPLDAKAGENQVITPRQMAEGAAREKAKEAARTVLMQGSSRLPNLRLEKLLAEKRKDPAPAGNGTTAQLVMEQIYLYMGSLDTAVAEPPLPRTLAEALAEIIAEHAAYETVQCLSYGNNCTKPIASKTLQEQVKEKIQDELHDALETVRWSERVRLFYQNANIITQLEEELARNALAESQMTDGERKVKAQLIYRLSAFNAALFQHIPPASETTGVPGQSADTQNKPLSETLQYATGSIRSFMQVAQAQKRTSGFTSAAALTIPETGAVGYMPNLWAGLLVDADGHVMAAVRHQYGGDWIVLKDERPLQPGTWVHYAAVIRYDSLTDTVVTQKDSSPLLYRDGSLTKGAPGRRLPDAITTVSCPEGFYIGGLCDTEGRHNFSGRVDEVRVWDRELSREDINTWRRLPGASFGEIAYWPFDDGPGRATLYFTPGGEVILPLLGPGWIESDIQLYQEASISP